MSSNNASPLATLANIFVDPAKAYDDIKSHNAWVWLPLILMILASLAMTVVFFAHADTAAMFQQQMAARHVQMTNQQMQAAAKFQTPAMLMLIGSFGAVFGILVVYALIGLYYMLVGKLAGWNDQRFSSWFSFAVWSAFPGILAVVVSLVVFLVRRQPATSFQDLDVLSLNALLFHVPMTSKWYSLASAFNPFSIWVVVLSIFGIARWTQRDKVHAALVVLVPIVVFYGLMAAFKAFT